MKWYENRVLVTMAACVATTVVFLSPFPRLRVTRREVIDWAKQRETKREARSGKPNHPHGSEESGR